MDFSKTGSQEPAIPGPPVLVHAPLSALAPTDTNTPLEEKRIQNGTCISNPIWRNDILVRTKSIHWRLKQNLKRTQAPIWVNGSIQNPT